MNNPIIATAIRSAIHSLIIANALHCEQLQAASDLFLDSAEILEAALGLMGEPLAGVCPSNAELLKAIKALHADTHE